MLNPRNCLPALLAMAVLSACSTLGRTTYEAPNNPVPAAWRHATGDAPGAQQGDWWQAFQRPELNRLIAEVRTSNLELGAAAIKLRRARLQAGLAADKASPTVSARLGNTQSRTLSAPEQSSRSYTTSLSVAWEADLWGRLSAQTDAARWEAEASEQDLASTALSLTTTAARLYWQKAYQKRRVELGEQSIAYVTRSLELARARYAAGAVTALDVFEAEQSLASQQASLLASRQQLEETDTALAVLLGRAPGDVGIDPAPLADLAPPEVSAGLPASLLSRRPDLRAAELRLRSTLASGDASRLAYYPSLSLTGSLGTSSTALRDALQNPLASLLTQLSLPFLQQREMRLNRDISAADYELALTSFRQTLHTALGEVENALGQRRQYAEQAALLQQSLTAARAAEQNYEARYRAGAATLQNWLDAQEKRRTAELALAENSYNRLSNHLSLIAALGGVPAAE